MTGLVVLVGPIAHWWDDNWDTPEHAAYVQWRTRVSEWLVEHGYLVYRPHEAFKGAWSHDAQVVNDCAITASKWVVNLTPPDVLSPGTDDEVAYATMLVPPKPVFRCPPPVEGDGTRELRHLRISLELGDCQVCGREPAYGVAAMPGVPISFAYGLGCLRANAHPLWVVVANTAMAGSDLNDTAEWWVELVENTLNHLGVTREAFDAMVAQAVVDQDLLAEQLDETIDQAPIPAVER